MLSDRELMELAARAAGYDPVRVTDDGVVLLRGVVVRWNPITDDGDRMRLARALGITIDFSRNCAWKRLPDDRLIEEFWNDGRGDEARALLRVAARTNGRI